MRNSRAEMVLNDADAERGVVPYRRQPSSLQLVDDEGDALGRPHDRAAQFWSIFQTLLRRRWLILAVLLIGLSGAAAYALIKTPLFRSSVTLEVQRQESQIMQGTEVQPATIADAEHMATQYALLKSRALAERVADVLDLPANPDFAEQDKSRSERLAQATSAILRSLEVSPVARSRVIEVSIRGPDAVQNARVANAMAENFIQMNLERKYNATSYARTFLEERLQTTKAALEEAERNLIEYARQQEILDLSSIGGSEIGSSLDAASLKSLNDSLADAQDVRITAEQRFIEARDSESDTREMLESDAIKTLRGRQSELASEYEEKLRSFKPDYPPMRELEAKIAAVTSDIERERASILSSLESEFRSAAARESALASRVAELKSEVQDLRGRSVDYNILSREADTLRGQYDALMQRFKEVSIATGIGASQVSIVDRADVPTRPFDPDLRFVLVAALVLSLAAAIGLALFLEYVDDTIKTPEDIKTKLGLAVLGVVPKLKGKVDVARMLRDPKSPISEAFSSARTALQFSGPEGAPKTLLVTGIRPSEGKTSTALALAVSFANIGERVLIVDADLRRPSFATTPGRSAGLSGYLTQNVSLRDHVVPGAFENLFLLPAGVVPPNPAELLTGPRLKDLLEEASSQFDLIIVDSPPVLDFADSPSLSAVCDATVLVLQAGGIRRPAALRTLERLVEAHGRVVGAVLTKFDVRRSDYSSGYTYSYGYSMDRQSLSAEARQRRRIQVFSDVEVAGDRKSDGS